MYVSLVQSLFEFLRLSVCQCMYVRVVMVGCMASCCICVFFSSMCVFLCVRLISFRVRLFLCVGVSVRVCQSRFLCMCVLCVYALMNVSCVCVCALMILRTSWPFL